MPELEEVRRPSFKIVIKRVSPPPVRDSAEEFNWICRTLGFFEPIDKDKTAANVFREIMLATEKGEALTSTALAERVNMSRGSVINHLNNLLTAGLIERHGRYYVSRAQSMQQTIEEIEEDIERIFMKMKKAAREIDEKMKQIEG
ncbi:MAG: winged helix-turn-helix transcriptional regulator [Candidatus Diapherotrites archaeon]|nr:winged helix-turn-helix transcriptional regulator [Candidatus Diapherotrites archaeon]